MKARTISGEVYTVKPGGELSHGDEWVEEDEPQARGPVHIEGRRWFRRGYGGTYHSVRIFRAGAQIAHIPMQYGYGEGFLQTAFDWLGKNGMPELLERHANGAPKNYGTQYLREVMHGTYSVIDVQRQKDL